MTTERPYLLVTLEDACRRQQVGEGWFASVADIPPQAISMSVVDLGAPTIRIFAGNLQKGTTEAQARAWRIEAIQECCEYAGPRGVILALENHGGIVSNCRPAPDDREGSQIRLVQ